MSTFHRYASLMLLALAGADDLCAGNGLWTSNGPYGGVVYDLQVDPTNTFTMYATTRGGLFRTIDGGTSWTRIESGLANAVIGTPLMMDRDAPAQLYVFDELGLLYRSTDGGDNWLATGYAVPSGLIPTRLTDLGGSTGRFVLTLSSYQQEVFPSADVMVLRTTDAGASFAPVSGIPGGMGFVDVQADPADPNLLLAGADYLFPNPPPATSPNILFRSTDGGSSFTAVYAPGSNPEYIPSILSIAFGAGARVYAASDSHGLLRSNDNGATWTELGEYVEKLVAHPAIADEVYEASSGFRMSTDGGVTWTNRSTGLTANPTYVDAGTALPIPVRAQRLVVDPTFPAPGSSVWIASDGGGVFRSTNVGLNWTNAGLNEGLAGVNLRAVAVHPNPSTIGPAGAGQRIYGGFSDAFYSTPGIFASTNGGATWATSNTQLEASTIRAIIFDPLRAGTTSGQVASSYLYASGRSGYGSLRARNGGIYRSTTGGLSWARIDGDLPRRGIAPNDYVDLGTVRDIRLDPRSCTIPLSATACTSGTLKRMYATSNGHRSTPVSGVITYTHRIVRSDNVDNTSLHPTRGTADVNWVDISGDLTPSTVTLGKLNQQLTPLNLLVSPLDPNVLFTGTFKTFGDLDPGDAMTVADVHTGVFKSTNGGVNWVPVNTGLPRVSGFSNVVYDVLALEMHPSNPNILWASVVDLSVPNSASIYKTTDGGATWVESANGISARIDIRDLMVDPGDANIVYAAGAGTASNPGAVYRSDDGGVTWRSISIGLPADSALALTLDPFNPALLHAGTNTGVWSLTQVPDADGDGIPDSEENNVLNGDGNGDGEADAAQRDVGSTGVIFRGPYATSNTGQFTNDVITAMSTPSVPGGCTQATDVQRTYSAQFGRDYVNGGPAYHRYPRELVRFEIQDCSRAIVDITYHGSNFAAQHGWTFRFHGPAVPGDDTSFGWFDFGQRASLRPPTNNTWRLTLDANQFGSYRATGDTILFMGGPACYDDRLMSDGFETQGTALPTCN